MVAVAIRGEFLETRLKRPITMLDALGLGLFATTGSWRALDASLPVVTALFVGGRGRWSGPHLWVQSPPTRRYLTQGLEGVPVVAQLPPVPHTRAEGIGL